MGGKAPGGRCACAWALSPASGCAAAAAWQLVGGCAVFQPLWTDLLPNEMHKNHEGKSGWAQRGVVSWMECSRCGDGDGGSGGGAQRGDDDRGNGKEKTAAGGAGAGTGAQQAGIRGTEGQGARGPEGQRGRVAHTRVADSAAPDGLAARELWEARPGSEQEQGQREAGRGAGSSAGSRRTAWVAVQD